jgi:3-deoxy-D-manno-octulosonate 8-phosphate phosphatase (KDO 8-P phosphatase)
MIKLLILDVDGVMTDGTKHYDRDGIVIAKQFCDKDWTAIKRFRAIGVNVCFLTGDGYNKTILENRNLDVIVNRGSGEHNDKKHYLNDILEKYKVTAEETAYVGDDLFDIGIMKLVKHAWCPLDSPISVHQVAKAIPRNGGKNCIAWLYDHLETKVLIPYVKYEDVIQKIYDLDIAEKF